MREQSFPDYHYNDWKKHAEDSLKGKSIESLQRATYENIILKPLYTVEDHQAMSVYPGKSDFRRGTDSLGYLRENWKIAQRLSYTDLEDLKGKLKLALESGQTALSIDVSKELFDKNGFLEELFKDYYCRIPFALDAGRYQDDVFISLEKLVKGQEDRANVTGYVANDPLADVIMNGLIPEHFSEILEEFSETVKKANESLPHLRTVLVNTSPYHNGGANAVQELGIAAATGVFYIQSLSGLEAEQIINQLIFKFSIGSNYFMEIAKLRAARVIWNKIAEAYGVSEDSRGMQIAADTSSFTTTLFDPYVNLLRGANEAFASVVGGVQYLHVNEFDKLTGSNSFSERIARNIQLILQEEPHLKTVIDPAGGSWYVEKLTNELATSAWAFFQEIEANGGILEVLKSNWLQTKISEVFEKRKADIFSRKQSIIGTNVYANLDDDAPKDIKAQTVEASTSPKEGFQIAPIPQVRLAQPYEALRMKAEELKRKSGSQPSVGLICLGSLKQHKARLDFVRGFLSAGGISVQPSQPIFSVEEAIEFVKDSDTKHFCICGTNDQYQILGIEILHSIKSNLADQIICLAGLPEQDEQVKWTENGLKQFLHVKSNCFETLSSILSEMEVSINEQIQA